MTMVICYRCLHGYDIETVPRRATKRLKRKEPACPNCKCKLYLNRTDDAVIKIDYEESQYTAMEE